ncbi:arylsulfatase [Draconibacterium sp. IB214405]|uniref:arylsulfatase n=1 Tax=Draconibacterium sp. IB214405 TaxID=3097352 RepID=UPI002A0DFB60|nr:arylsulfatase [Draconibacterium sp. IB214405]MDX8340694.1 arylsulfatase [Draconibacterium sp. IB214405]
MTRLFLLIVIAAFLSSCTQKVELEPSKPNVIYILADDLGYGDLSCYGQKKFSTPNIDKLAGQGMLFTQHYSGSTVCAPSRSALMTGQHTGHTYIRGNWERPPEGQHPLITENPILPELFKQAGYTTGAFGKWGLGYPGSEGDPNNKGFDVFFGYNCQMLGHHYYPYFLRSNQDSLVLEANAGTKTGIYAPQLIHEKTIEFIEENKDKPFFLYVPSIIPHAELFAPEEYMERFRGKFDPEHAYKGVDEGERFRKGPYGSQPESHAAFAAMVALLDEQVGEIVAKVEELGIADNTIIIFTSDNGPHLEGGAQPDYFDSNGPLKGYKRDLYEGGIRVPFIASWPGKIPEGTTSDHISAFWDILPTFTDIIGAPAPGNIDGISMLPTLSGKGTQSEHEYLYWEFHVWGGRKAVRMGDWKGVQYGISKDPDVPIQLYNLKNDIGETTDVADKYPEVVEQIKEIMGSASTPSEIFKF